MKSHGWDDFGSQTLTGPMAGAIVRRYMKNGCNVLVGKEDRHGRGELLYHLSISRPDRYPTWDEIKDARYTLLPNNLTFAMMLPPMSEYVNVHNNCFHLWEIDDT